MKNLWNHEDGGSNAAARIIHVDNEEKKRDEARHLREERTIAAFQAQAARAHADSPHDDDNDDDEGYRFDDIYVAPEDII